MKVHSIWEKSDSGGQSVNMEGGKLLQSAYKDAMNMVIVTLRGKLGQPFEAQSKHNEQTSVSCSKAQR